MCESIPCRYSTCSVLDLAWDLRKVSSEVNFCEMSRDQGHYFLNCSGHYFLYCSGVYLLALY